MAAYRSPCRLPDVLSCLSKIPAFRQFFYCCCRLLLLLLSSPLLLPVLSFRLRIHTLPSGRFFCCPCGLRWCRCRNNPCRLLPRFLLLRLLLLRFLPPQTAASAHCLSGCRCHDCCRRDSYRCGLPASRHDCCRAVAYDYRTFRRRLPPLRTACLTVAVMIIAAAIPSAAGVSSADYLSGCRCHDCYRAAAAAIVVPGGCRGISNARIRASRASRDDRSSSTADRPRR